MRSEVSRGTGTTVPARRPTRGSGLGGFSDTVIPAIIGAGPDDDVDEDDDEHAAAYTAPVMAAAVKK